jgi:hypothetical protein
MRVSFPALTKTLFPLMLQNEHLSPARASKAKRVIASMTHSSQMDTFGPSARYLASRPQKLQTITSSPNPELSMRRDPRREFGLSPIL